MSNELCHTIMSSETIDANFNVAVATLYALAARYFSIIEKHYWDRFQYVLYLYTSENHLRQQLTEIENLRREWQQNAAIDNPDSCSAIVVRLNEILVKFEIDRQCDLLTNFIDPRPVVPIGRIDLCMRLACAFARYQHADPR